MVQWTVIGKIENTLINISIFFICQVASRFFFQSASFGLPERLKFGGIMGIIIEFFNKFRIDNFE